MDIKAGHPHHTGIKGNQGGSRPSVNNNLMKACANILPKQQAAVRTKLEPLKNPIGRFMKGK